MLGDLGTPTHRIQDSGLEITDGKSDAQQGGVEISGQYSGLVGGGSSSSSESLIKGPEAGPKSQFRTVREGRACVSCFVTKRSSYKLPWKISKCRTSYITVPELDSRKQSQKACEYQSAKQEELQRPSQQRHAGGKMHVRGCPWQEAWCNAAEKHSSKTEKEETYNSPGTEDGGWPHESPQPPPQRRTPIIPNVESEETFRTRVDIKVTIHEQLKWWLGDDDNFITRPKQDPSSSCQEECRFRASACVPDRDSLMRLLPPDGL